ncbi:MAG: hypothetical protein JXA30_16505 [Deltaproteobacteria bacterium]|nr:hypothetical protein [Deltaproteobacteria bacterium]
MVSSSDRSWRLLPSERVLWQGGPKLGIPRDRRWIIVPGLLFAFAVVTALFAGLLWIAGIAAVRTTAFIAFYLLLTAVAIWSLPQYQLDPCRYMVTDRNVIWKRGKLKRSIERKAITYARIYWHRNTPGVGSLELVRAVPFGPLLRKQRLVLHDVEAPDRLFALIRDAEPTIYAGYADVKLTDRLDRGETVLWGDGPMGWRLGHAEALNAITGLLVLVSAMIYIYRTVGILVALEQGGVRVDSWTWILLFLAIFISGAIIVTVGVVLLWKGLWGARADGSRTEYLLTDSRLLIRRGRVELSIDRKRIVDLALVRSTAGSTNLHLILDGPYSRALDDNGALSLFASPPRAAVPPVLYEIREPELIRDLLFKSHSEPIPPLKAA